MSSNTTYATSKRARAKTSDARTPKESGRQAQKSASTRRTIAEAALRCVIKYGYAQTTTPLIADEAGLSRGAMMHHFSNRLTVMQAAIEYLHTKRLKAFRRAISSLPPSKARLHDALIAYWRQVTHPLFVAFHELAVASRTDKDLEKILRPAQQSFREEWYQLAVDQFPEWQSDKKSFDLALNFVQATLEGMATARLSTSIDQEAEDELIAHLEQCLAALMPAKTKQSGRRAAK